MPSPFPGIDPYLESQHYWPDFHDSFLTYCRDALNEGLPESYEARLGSHLRLVERENPDVPGAIPDVAVVALSSRRREAAGGVAVLETLQPVMVDLPAREVEEVRELWIEIRHRPERSLVTAIEVLSPTNKEGRGYWEYLEKRRNLTDQQVHLVELDLLISGRRLPMRQDLPPGHYFAIVSRAERRPHCEVYAWSLRHPLPKIPIPLRPPDPDVILDLPALFALGYERGLYARSLDYAAPLDLPLSPEDRAWAEGLARAGRT